MQAGDPIYWTWIRILRRVELGFGEGKARVGSDTVQHVAAMAVTYGDPDGTHIRPSVARLARVCRKDEKTVRRCLGRLREVGLFIRVFEGSSAGRSGKADEYHLAIPDDLLQRVAMLDPDEKHLVVPEGVQPPRLKKPRAKKTAAPAAETPGGAPADEPKRVGRHRLREPGSPGAAPADVPVDNRVSPGAAPGDQELLAGNHRVLLPGTPGAASKNTGCSTRPPTQGPTQRPTQHADISPYGAEEEGSSAARREPPAKTSTPRYRQPPLMVAVPDLPDTADYERARDALAVLPDLGHALITQARRDLGPTAPLTALVVHAHALLRRSA
ncbi:hypothetical protein [Sphaerisporangium sp. TRM90804]|uniref:hypothetical protein n=1 Tax=Sphaerisporangium sp. TRM90804 TaxID=3031113 RepID=UPI002449C820|nr:hypothetical protein [Sphaerisporangium sp. TRM90804]MDH2425744.1 hypothetical protein [Sphaerisporangium sp. TRM90804]